MAKTQLKLASKDSGGPDDLDDEDDELPLYVPMDVKSPIELVTLIENRLKAMVTSDVTAKDLALIVKLSKDTIAMRRVIVGLGSSFDE